MTFQIVFLKMKIKLKAKAKAKKRMSYINFKNIVEFPTPDIRDENLYVPKKTRVLKDKLFQKVEEFKNYKKCRTPLSGILICRDNCGNISIYNNSKVKII